MPRIIGVLLGAGALGGIISVAPLFSPQVHTLAVPLWETRESLLSLAYVAYDSVTTKESLVRENRSLHEELSRLKRETFQTSILEAENKKLKALLGRSDTSANEVILASVLRGPAASPYDTLVIDAGTEEGVVGGELVRVSGGVAIGFVREVYMHNSLVLLFSAYGEELPVILGSATTTHVTAFGQGSGMFEISVPSSFVVEVGDPIRIPSLKGELVAAVEAIEVDSSGSFAKVYFRTPVNLGTVRFVEVARNAVWRETSN